MIRLVAVALLAALFVLVFLKLLELARHRNIDWTGIAAFIGFVVMAFWLRHVTGIG
jgi:hypothetical protein